MNFYSYFIIFLHEFSVSLVDSLVFLFGSHDLNCQLPMHTPAYTHWIRTRRKMRTVQKSLCSLSLNIFPEEDRPIRHEKLSSSVVPLEAQLCHFEWLSHTQRNTHDFCVSTVLPISVPSSCVSVRQPIPHMHIIISVSSCIVTFAEHVLHLKSPLPC